ncbi:MAG: sulfotransferase family protein [Bacteroidota bacterium]
MKTVSPLLTFTKKLKAHGAFKNNPNKKMIGMVYFKILLSEPFRLLEKKRYDGVLENTDPERAPVFIIGHWRSGTTYTHTLLSQDPGFVYQTKYQNFFSDNFLTTEDFFKPLISKTIDFFSPVGQWQSRISKSMNLDTPSESDTALISEISEYTYHWAHLFPKAYEEYFNKYLFCENLSEQELKNWQNTMRTMISKAYLRTPYGRLLIKNPGDTARIKYLLDIYPDARFVFIHRNPYEVFYSNLKLWNLVQQSVAMQQITEEEKKQIVLKVYTKLHQHYLEQKKLLKPHQLIELGFDEISEKPLQSVEKIYRQLSLKGFDDAHPWIKNFLKEQPPRRNQQYEFKKEDLRLINEYWDLAFKQWNYPKLDPDKEMDEAS